MSGIFPGLVLVARTGVRWRWVGHDVIATRRGEQVRVERFEAPCRACDRPFTVHARLPAAIRRAYLCRRSRGVTGELSYQVPADKRIRGFELRNCPTHRWARDPLELV